ncbi:hypothetical protein JOB18_008918 [Solea senegalensis]|uniref:Uncharacterized protein n=1 Tax=Solea senegalensis TaxID=28829 RepID=A0AAV6PR17_SOLSE|nr:hypothetical protein JOB18_008918 [Solea senegalensis]
MATARGCVRYKSRAGEVRSATSSPPAGGTKHSFKDVSTYDLHLDAAAGTDRL